MQLADGAHRSYGKGLSAEMKVTVVELPEPAKVSFLEPVDGAKVKSPFKVKFGLKGMTISPAGSNVLDKTKGHHHIIVDGKPLAAGTAVPANETHIHFGKGQTETELKLKPSDAIDLAVRRWWTSILRVTLSSTITVEVTE